jgi:hypothetical protein
MRNINEEYEWVHRIKELNIVTHQDIPIFIGAKHLN